jgi:transcriptional regulator with XRE-family HTH domain
MTDIEAERLSRRRKIGEVIRSLRGDMSQEALGIALAKWNTYYPGSPYPQTTISRWERGDVEFSVESLMSIEAALGLPQGLILQRAGIVKTDDLHPETVKDVILVDPSIHPMLRDHLLGLYVEMMKISKKLFIEESFVGKRSSN